MTEAITGDEAETAYLNLRSVVRSNLEYQHYWTDLRLLDTTADLQAKSSAAGGNPTTPTKLPRPMIVGRPPDQLYTADPAGESAENKDKDKDRDKDIDKDESKSVDVDLEFILPIHLQEKWTLAGWAAVFDALPAPAGGGPDQKKRIVVAVVSGDSTIVYYIMHDGIVKPRQN